MLKTSIRTTAVTVSLLLASAGAHAAPLKVMVSGAMAHALQEVSEDFARKNGQMLDFVANTTGVLQDKLRAGEKTDIIEVAEFPQYVQHYAVRVTPTIVIDETLVLPDAQDEAGLIEAILRHVEGKPPLQGTPVPTGTPFALPSREGQQAAPKETVTASGLILPGR